MLYKVNFEDGEPISAEEFHPASKNYDTSQYRLIENDVKVYLWRIIEAVSEVAAIEKAMA